MPALFAYLFSLIIFVGGGYAGLIWLTEPPAAVPTVVAAAKAHPHPRRHHEPDLSAEASGSETAHSEQSPPAKQVEAAKPDIVTTSAAKEADASPAPDEAGGKKDEVADKKPDQQTAVVESPPANIQADHTDQTDNANAQINSANEINSADNQQSEPTKPAGDTPTKAVLNQETISTPALPTPATSTQATSTQATSTQATSTPATAAQTTATHTSARPPSRPHKVASIRNDGRAEKTMERHSAPRASQSHLVMMTLQTLEFADGHREQRLMPLRRSRSDEDD